MAADWIPWEDGLQDKPEILAMAYELGIDKFSVAGRCAAVWAWAGRYTATGLVERVRECDVDDVSQTKNFASALEKVGWLRFKKDGVFFVGWNTYNSKSAKARKLDARRKAEDRRVSVLKMSGSKPDKHGTTVQDSTGQEISSSSSSFSSLEGPACAGAVSRKETTDLQPGPNGQENQASLAESVRKALALTSEADRTEQADLIYAQCGALLSVGAASGAVVRVATSKGVIKKPSNERAAMWWAACKRKWKVSL